jgi:hypothetical protein
MDSVNNITITWDIVTVDKFIEVCNLDIKSYSDIDLYYFNVLSILLDIDDDVIQDMDYREFTRLKLNVITLFNYLPTKPNPKLTINDELEFNLIQFNKITLGEFVDIEIWLRESFINNYGYIMSVLYRQQLTEGNYLYEPTYEEYGSYVTLRKKIFNNCSIKDTYGAIQSYLSFREKLFKTYAGLLNNGETTDNEPTPEELSKLSMKDKIELQQAIDKEKRLEKWGWNSLILKLADNDILKVEQVSKLPLIQCFNILAMRVELGMMK